MRVLSILIVGFVSSSWLLMIATGLIVLFLLVGGEVIGQIKTLATEARAKITTAEVGDVAAVHSAEANNSAKTVAASPSTEARSPVTESTPDLQAEILRRQAELEELLRLSQRDAHSDAGREA